MVRITLVLLLLIAVAAFTGCNKPVVKSGPQPPAEDHAAAPQATPESTPDPTPETLAEAQAAPTPESQMALPEGLPKVVHVYPEITVTGVTTLNADENQYEIKGETRKSVVQVMNYYINYFRENGWEEDMIMEHEGNTVVSFTKDGILQYIDATEGGYGCYVTITTGNY